MFVDQNGLTITAANENAVMAFNKTILSYLSLSKETSLTLKSIFSYDPDMVMAHCLKGYFLILMGNTFLFRKASESYLNACKLKKYATKRERAHIAALGKWCSEDEIGTMHILEEILSDYPLDILALRLAHHIHFYSGNAIEMCRSIENVMPYWNKSIPGYGFVLGMLAFAHQENHNFKYAEKQGKSAIELNPHDPWAIHSVLHVMEMQDRQDSGIKWLKDLKPFWNKANNFRYHLWWHFALLHIDNLNFGEALALYDEEIWDPVSDEYLDYCNDVSLLIRLEICGVDVGQRWVELTNKIERRSNEHIRTFVDAHYVLALGATENWEGATKLIKTFSHKGGHVRLKVGVPLCRALVDYKKQNYLAAYNSFSTLADRIFLIGGSNAQRDLFMQIKIDSAIKSKQYVNAKGLLRQRLDEAPNNQLTQKWLLEVNSKI